MADMFDTLEECDDDRDRECDGECDDTREGVRERKVGGWWGFSISFVNSAILCSAFSRDSVAEKNSCW